MRTILPAGNAGFCLAKLWTQRPPSCSFQLNASLCMRTYDPVLGKSRVASQPYALSTSICTSKFHSQRRNVTSLRSGPVSILQNERYLVQCGRSSRPCSLLICGGFSRPLEQSSLASSLLQALSSRAKTSSFPPFDADCFMRSLCRATLTGEFCDMIGGRQLRVRKHSKTTTETVLADWQTEQMEIGNAAKGTKKRADGVCKTSKPQATTCKTVEKLNKEDFAVDSWQYKVLELHEDNNLNSLTVMEICDILRKMNRPAKGLKADLLKSVKKWLSDHGCSTTAPEIVQSTGGEPQPIKEILPKAKVVAANSAVADSLGQGTRSGTKRTVPKCTPPEKSKKRKKVADVELSDPVDSATQSAEAEKPTTNKKGSRRAARSKEINDSEEILEDIVLKTGTLTEDKREAWTMLVHKKPQPGWVAYNPTTMRPAPLTSDEKFMKLVSWNVNGLRALLKEKGIQHEQGSLIARLATREDFDVLCLQETKLQDKDVERIQESLLVSHEESLWSCSTRKLGYSGTAVISRIKPLSVQYGLGNSDHDHEGRLITVEFESFYFVVSYVPNSGANLDRLAYRTEEWDPALSKYLKDLEKKKPVILTGDLNCAHEEIDIHNPAGNKRSAGFTDEERESFKTNFLDQGFVDTFRKQHPNAVGYTYWGYRTAARPKNQGWRLDYFLASESLADRVHDSYTIPDVGGSDHCPIGLILKT